MSNAHINQREFESGSWEEKLHVFLIRSALCLEKTNALLTTSVMLSSDQGGRLWRFLAGFVFATVSLQGIDAILGGAQVPFVEILAVSTEEGNLFLEDQNLESLTQEGQVGRRNVETSIRQQRTCSRTRFMFGWTVEVSGDNEI